MIEGPTASAIHSFGSLLMGVASLIGGILLWQRFKVKDIDTTRNLSKFLLSFGVFQLIIGIPTVIESSIGLELFRIFGHIFLFISLAYFSTFALEFTRPEWKNFAFTSNLIIGGLSMLFFFSYGEIVYPIIAVIAFANWGGLGALPFFYLSFQKDDYNRWKFIIVGLGFLALSILEPLTNLSTNRVETILLETFTIVSVLIIVGGSYFEDVIDFPE